MAEQESKTAKEALESIISRETIRGTEQFYLMNKDSIVLKFSATVVGEKLLFNLDMSSIDKLPPNFTNLDRFLESRTIVTRRSDVLAYLSELGVKSKFDLLLLSYGVSLTDTLWVKRVSDNMKWEVVSPYNKKNIFDISWFLSSSKQKLNLINRYKPEYSTDGNFPKCWITEEGKHRLIKCGTSGMYNAGLEPFSEMYANQIENLICMSKSYVLYDLTVIDYEKYNQKYKIGSFLKEELSEKTNLSETERIASICDAFTNEQNGLVSASDLSLHNYKEVWDFAKRLGDTELRKLAELYLSDCLILNVDRHLGNISFVFNNDSFEVKALSPNYDNNLSLLCYWVEQQDGTAIEYAKSCYTKLGYAFKDLGRGVLSEFSEYRSELKQIEKYFEFKPCGRYNFNESRLSKLSEVVRYQAAELLK